MKAFLKKLLLEFLRKYHSRKHYRFYKKLMKINHFHNLKEDGENDWMSKWGKLGMKVNPIYYRLFSRYIGKDINIVPEDICHDVIEAILNPHRFAKYYSDKNVFDKLFPKGYLPKTILRKMGGFYYDANYCRVDINEEKFLQCLNSAGVDKIIVKPSVEGSSGKGVRVFLFDKNQWLLCRTNDQLMLNYLDVSYGDNLIIQEFLEQHEEMNYYCKTCVNTLRITLYRSVKNDESVVTSAIMRIGRDGSIVDNAHAGGGFVGINVENGLLANYVCNQYGEKSKVFNNIDFTLSHQIPIDLWQKVLFFAKSIGQYVPHHRLLALDLMIDNKGNPRLVEFNCEYYSMWLFQFAIGTAFGKYTDEILEYCLKKKDKIEYQIFL